MREQKYHVYLTADEQGRVIQSLIRLKNNLITEGRYTDAGWCSLQGFVSQEKASIYHLITYRLEYKRTAYTEVQAVFWEYDPYRLEVVAHYILIQFC